MLDCMTRFMNSGKNERSRETHCKSARCSCEIDAAIDDEIETPLAKEIIEGKVADGNTVKFTKPKGDAPGLKISAK